FETTGELLQDGQPRKAWPAGVLGGFASGWRRPLLWSRSIEGKADECARKLALSEGQSVCAAPD
ncbi:MAG: hypothetical protein RBU30_01315, partial [Polyangia bacterium]|nr:hypothetical protein [Polyangia bacterium]